MKGPWFNFAYECVPRRIAFWQRRATRNNGDRVIWYAAPHPDHPTDPRRSIKDEGRTYIPQSLRDRCVHGLDDIREAVAEGKGGELVWTEGETDKRTANDEDCWAFTHPNAAGSSTYEQAGHLRRYKGRVYVAADRDDAGYSCAARRVVQLQEAGIRRARIEIIAAHPSIEKRGADLRDHFAAGYGWDEMAVLRAGDLREAIDRFRARASTSGSGTSGLAGPVGAFYHGGQLSLSDEEWEQYENSALRRGKLSA
ncbi:hypothetical protein WCD74_11660 [Actinomycetospora sp. OC33-EN08]|uniref:Toprim domain-containing protein n=1 Tax=Actinomycetospora aurantiaca TaxID=3129233 RepID=A0ABU8MN80_9PSEU